MVAAPGRKVTDERPTSGTGRQTDRPSVLSSSVFLDPQSSEEVEEGGQNRRLHLLPPRL